MSFLVLRATINVFALCLEDARGTRADVSSWARIAVETCDSQRDDAFARVKHNTRHSIRSLK